MGFDSRLREVNFNFKRAWIAFGLGVFSFDTSFADDGFARFNAIYGDSKRDCYGQCYALVLSGLQPFGRTRELLKWGADASLSWKPSFLRTLDDFFFSNSFVPFWSQLRFSFATYFSQFRGDSLGRTYTGLGVAPGIAHRMSLTDSGEHDWLTQFDFRAGLITASRDGKQATGFNTQPTIYTGYVYSTGSFELGLLGQVLLSSDVTPLTAVGAALRIGIRID